MPRNAKRDRSERRDPWLALAIAVFAAASVFAGVGNARAEPPSAVYELDPESSIQLAGQPAGPLQGTIQLNRGEGILCVQESLPCPKDYRMEIHVSGAGVDLAPRPLPPVPTPPFHFALADLSLDELGALHQGEILIERVVLAQGQREPGTGFAELREVRLAPGVSVVGEPHGELRFESENDQFPTALALKYVLEERKVTVLFDSDPNDLRAFLPAIEPGSESLRALGQVVLRATSIPLPLQKLFLASAAETVEVGASNCVSATVTDGDDQLVPGAFVTFTLSALDGMSVLSVTNDAGQATLCYSAGDVPGEDRRSGDVSIVPPQ